MIITVLVLCLWIGVNTGFQWFPVPPEVTEARFPPVTTTPRITLTMGFVGHLIVLVGAGETMVGVKYFKG